MFYIAEIKDRIRISLTSQDKENEDMRKLLEKYINSMLKDSSVCFLLTKIIKIDEYRVVDEFLVAKVRFEMLLFKFLRREILHGRILEHNESGTRLGIPFFDGLKTDKNDLPAVSEM